MRCAPFRILILPALLASPAFAQDTRPHRLTPVPIRQVSIDDDFWSPKRKVWQKVTIPDCFTKFENDRGGAINNFDRVRDGKPAVTPARNGTTGLIYEMIRGTADFLAAEPDPGWKRGSTATSRGSPRRRPRTPSATSTPGRS